MTPVIHPATSLPGSDCATTQVASKPVRSVRVLHLINGEHYSGAERVQDLLALGLAQQGFEVGFACLKPGRFAAMRRSQQAPLVELPMRRRMDLGPVRVLARKLKEDGYELLHTHTPRAAFVGSLASLLSGVPMVHHLHSPTTADSTRWLHNRLSACTERLSLSGVKAVIAVSGSLGEYAGRQGIPGAKIWVVPNGVPIQGPLAVRRAPSGTWTLGVVALFRPRKGLEVLIDALAELREQGLSVRLRAVGPFETPQYETLIRDQVQRLKLQSAIDWVGFTREVTEEFGRMDLFALPSLFGEGLPMVLLEAMAAGVPVIGTRVEGVPEAVRDGVDGLLVEAGNSKTLAQAIRRVVEGDADWSALRVSAHQRQSDRFSDRSMAQGVAQVYRQVLEQ